MPVAHVGGMAIATGVTSLWGEFLHLAWLGCRKSLTHPCSMCKQAPSVFGPCILEWFGDNRNQTARLSGPHRSSAPGACGVCDRAGESLNPRFARSGILIRVGLRRAIWNWCWASVVATLGHSRLGSRIFEGTSWAKRAIWNGREVARVRSKRAEVAGTMN